MSLPPECRLLSAAVLKGEAKASGILVGQAPSGVKGMGLEYEDYRDYSPGDDVKRIDWRLTARAVTPEGSYRLIVREYRAERKLKVLFVVDLSLSMGFGKKIETAVYTLSLLAFTSARVDDETSLLLLGPKRREFYPQLDPRVIPRLVALRACKEGAGGAYSLADATDVIKRTKARALVVAVTDYAHEPEEYGQLAMWARRAGGALLFYIVYSKWEVSPPAEALVSLVDPETGTRVEGKLSEIYGMIRDHVKSVKALARAKGARLVELCERSDAERRSWEIIAEFLRSRELVLR